MYTEADCKKKKKRERERETEREKDQTKAFEANIKHNIHNFYLVIRFRMVSFRVKESLDHAQEQVSCKCLH